MPGVERNEAELRIDFARYNGARIQLLGAENPDTIRGAYLDGVVFDEYALMRPRTWTEVVRPMLVDRRGWAIFIGTPMGRNHFYTLYEEAKRNPEWSTAFYRASDTGIVPQVELDSATKSMSQDQYDQEFECSWAAAIPGAYYAEELRRIEEEGCITTLTLDPQYPVCTGWDLGHNDSNAIWFFQQAGNEVRFLDYLEGHSIALKYPNDPKRQGWIDQVRAKPYIYDHSRLVAPLTRQSYELHYGPHDLAHHEYSTGKTRYTFALEHGFRFTVIPRGLIEDGILASRALLSRAVFDETRCAAGLEALRNYQREWDEEKRVFREHPLHNWASNGADAFRTVAVGIQTVPEQEPQTPIGGSFVWARQEVKRQQRGQRPRSFKVFRG